MAKFNGPLIFFTCLLLPLLSRGFEDSFVVTTERQGNEHLEPKEGPSEAETIPKIYEMQVDSNVTNRFARTLVTSKVRNLNSVAKEATFFVILPDKAFISEFVMIVGGKKYKAYVKEKEEAQNIYQQAVQSGVGAAHVAVSVRESNRFTVSLNIEPHSKATFLLTYEELLRRRDNTYELIINIHPKQPVKDLFVNVFIDESRPLKFVKTPAIRSGNEITKGEGDLDPRADINHINSTTVMVKFRPNIERQKTLAANLGTDVNEGLSGQFVVQYDVERDPNGGEVLVQDGYFVHFFAPSEIKALNKFIVFVLDTSGSMYGQKILQVKEAMNAILAQLDVNDYFHIVTFQSNAKVWNVTDPSKSTETSRRSFGWYEREQPKADFTDLAFPRAVSGSSDNIKNAKQVMPHLQAGGGTNLYDALRVVLTLIEREKESLPPPIIMFLTDGQGDVGADQTVSDITKSNTAKAPIYSLSFGKDADKDFLKKLSQKNYGFSRHIYEASDAALQLGNFYKEIASPLLRNVRFEYVPETTDLTKTEFPIHFGGAEIVVAGKIETDEFSKMPQITGIGCLGHVVYRPTVEAPVTSLERLWAYLTVQQLLDDRDTADNKTVNEKKALDLALKYSFVTPVSSLVVVKPNTTDSTVNAEAADKTNHFGGPGYFPGGGRMGSYSPSSRSSTPIGLSLPSGLYSSPGAPGISARGIDAAGSLNYFSTPLAMGPGMTHSAHAGGIKPEGFSYGLDQQKGQPGMGYGSVAPSWGQPLPVAGPVQNGNLPLLKIGYDTVSSTPRSTSHLHNAIVVEKIRNLKAALPWLTNILNDDWTLSSPPGNYRLGVRKSYTNLPECPETPTNTTGHCSLLHECPQVHHLLTSEDVFVRYFCPINRRYAGVCCPH